MRRQQCAHGNLDSRTQAEEPLGNSEQPIQYRLVSVRSEPGLPDQEASAPASGYQAIGDEDEGQRLTQTAHDPHPILQPV